MITVASLRKEKTRIGGCRRSTEVEIIEPHRSYAAVSPGDLWILPGPRKTHTTRFPPPLDGANHAPPTGSTGPTTSPVLDTNPDTIPHDRDQGGVTKSQTNVASLR